MAVRSQRNNNPGNVRSGEWEGKIGIDNADGGPFVIFATPEHGVRSMVITLYNYQSRHGIRTIREIINRWAPSKENDTEGYINFISNETGINPDQPLDFRNDSETMRKIINAMIRKEGGNSALNYFNPHIAAGIEMANGTRTTPSTPNVTTLPGLGNPDSLLEQAPELPEGVGVDSQTSTAGPTTRGGRRGSVNNSQSFSSQEFNSMKDVLSFLEKENQFWENELDWYENYSYNLELFIPPATVSEEFLNPENDNFEQVAHNLWPPSGVKYITIAKTATTSEFNIDNLQIKSMGEGSGNLSKLVGTAVNLSFDITQIGNTSLNDTLFGAAMLMGYASITDVVYYMKITFNGYDITAPGIPIKSQDTPLTKIIPFKLSKLKDIATTTNETGTVATLEGVVVQDMVTTHAINTTEFEFEVKIKNTLQETLKELEKKLNEQEEQNNIYNPEDESQSRFLNTYVINMDDPSLTDILKNGKMNGILANKSSGTNDVENRTNALNVSSQSAKITPGISLIDLIYDICIQSIEIRNELLKSNETESFVPRIEPVIVPKSKGYNPVTGSTGHTITYNIIIKRQVIVQNQIDQLSKMQNVRKILDDIYGKGRARKVYYYHYTGLNDQILDLTISLDRQLIKSYNTPKDSWLWHNFVKPGTDLHANLTEKQRAKLEELEQDTNTINKNKKSLTSDLEKKENELSDKQEEFLNKFIEFQDEKDAIGGPSNSVDFSNLKNNIDNPQFLATLQQIHPELFTEFMKSNRADNLIDEIKKTANDIGTINGNISTANRELRKVKSSQDRLNAQVAGTFLGDDFAEFGVKQQRLLNNIFSGTGTNGLILAEELGDDFLTKGLSGEQFKALLDALLLNPITFKRSILPQLIEEKKPELFKSTDPEDLELARQKFYESTDADLSMHVLSMTIKGDPFWLEHYLTPQQSRLTFGQNNSTENFKGFSSRLNGLNYFTLVVNKADGVDQFDNVKIDTLEIFLYMVRSTVNVFSGGQFTQTFDAIRIPVPENFQDIPKIEAVGGNEDLLVGFGVNGENVGGAGTNGDGIGIDAFGGPGENIGGEGNGDNVDLGDGTGGNGVSNTPSEINFQGDLVDPLLTNLTGEGLQALLNSLNGEGGTTENAEYVLNQFAANFGTGLDDIPEELHDVYTKVMVTAGQISGNDPTDFGFSEEQVAGAISTSPGDITTDIADGIIFGDNALNDSPVTIGIPSTNSERDIVIPTDTLTTSEMNTVQSKSKQIDEIMSGRNYEDLNENERKRVNELSGEIKTIVDKATTGDRASVNDAAVITGSNNRLDDLQTQLDDVNRRLDGFQLTEEERQADLKLREELQQKILIEKNNTPPVIVDEITQPINPDSGEPGVDVSYKPRIPVDDPIILPKPPGELPNPSIDNGDGTITVPVSTLSGDLITVEPGVKKQLINADTLYRDIMETIEELPYQEVERTFTYPDGTVDTWTERIRDFSQMPPTISYVDENGNTQSLNTSDLPLPVGETITLGTLSDIKISVADLYPNVGAGYRKTLDPKNPGGPLKVEIGGLSFTPIDLTEEDE